MGDGGRSWAVGGVLGDDLSGVDRRLGVVVGGSGTGDERGNSSGGGETHLDGLVGVLSIYGRVKEAGDGLKTSGRG